MNVLDIFEQIAESGHAPKYGCRLFSVGYEDALERIRVQYLESRFDRGLSAEKFVVGPFGNSGFGRSPTVWLPAAVTMPEAF